MLSVASALVGWLIIPSWGLGFLAYVLLLRHLEEAHHELWCMLGQPVWYRRQWDGRFRLLRFLFGDEHLAFRDARLSTLLWLTRFGALMFFASAFAKTFLELAAHR